MVILTAYYGGSAGHFYVCGNAGGDPTLYQVTVSSAGVASGTAKASAALTTAATKCGPVTEIYNPNASPATDWIFTSVQAAATTATPISCPASSGCIMSFNVTKRGTALTTSTATVGHTTVAGGPAELFLIIRLSRINWSFANLFYTLGKPELVLCEEELVGVQFRRHNLR